MLFNYRYYSLIQNSLELLFDQLQINSDRFVLQVVGPRDRSDSNTRSCPLMSQNVSHLHVDDCSKACPITRFSLQKRAFGRTRQVLANVSLIGASHSQCFRVSRRRFPFQGTFLVRSSSLKWIYRGFRSSESTLIPRSFSRFLRVSSFQNSAAEMRNSVFFFLRGSEVAGNSTHDFLNHIHVDKTK